MNYYYLISGLPDLSLDEDAPIIDGEEVVDTIRRNLTPSDETLFQYLLYPNDNRNFLKVLFYKYHNLPQPTYSTPATLSEPDLQNYLRQQSVFPSYLSEFIQSYEDQFTSLSPQRLEESLWTLFYEETEQQDVFLANYFRFDRQLKELAAIYNSTSYSFLTEPVTTEEREVRAIGGGRTIPAAWLRDYPYIESLEEAMATSRPDRIERFMDRIRWEYLEEISGFFGREQVYAYTLKLFIVTRWQQLAQQPPSSYFEDLMSAIQQPLQKPKTST